MHQIHQRAHVGPLAGKAAVAYYRASSSSQDKSVGQQRDAVRAWADGQGIRLVGEYVDDGVSGFKRGREGRPGFDRMLSEVGGLGVDLVVVWSIDRFGRQFKRGLIEILLLEEAGVRLADTEVGLYGFDDLGEAVTLVARSHAAEDYSRKLSHAVTRGTSRERDAGAWHGVAPYGFETYRDGDGHMALRPVPAEAPIVREIFDRVDAGESLTAVARDLNARGLRRRPRRTRRIHTGDEFQNPISRPWLANAIRQMMRQAAHGGYRATARDPGNQTPTELTPARIETIVPRDQWRRLFDRYTVLAYRRARTRKYPLSGLVYCGACGERMHVREARTRGVRRYYRCSRMFENCDAGLSIRVDLLEAELIEWFKEIIAETDLETIARETADIVHDQRAEDQTACQPLREELDRLTVHEGRLIDLQIETGDTAAVAAKLKTIQARRQAIEDELRARGSNVEGCPTKTWSRSCGASWAA